MGVPPISHLGTKCLEVTYDIGSAELIFLPRHQTVLLGSALPHNGKRQPGWTGYQPVLLRIVAVGWPSHFRRWCCSLFPVEEVTAHPPHGSPCYARGRPLFRCGEEMLLSYTKDKNRSNGDADYKFFLKYFSWTQSRTERSSGQRFYPRPPHGRFPGSSCPQSDGHPPGGPESPARS